VAKKGVKAFWVLCLYRRRPELVGFAPGDQASVAFVAVAAAAHVAVPPVAAAVVRAAPVGFVPEPVHAAFVAAAAAEQLRAAVVAVAVAAALVLRLVRLAAVVVAPAELHVPLAPHLLHARLDVARSADVAPVAVESVVEPEQLVATKFARFVVHRVRVAHLSPETSVPSHDRVQYSRASPLPGLDGIAVLPVSCS
jgi:hypothetical protein